MQQGGGHFSDDEEDILATDDLPLKSVLRAAECFKT